MHGTQRRFLWAVCSLLVVITQVAVVRGSCILQIKLPLAIWGYAPNDYVGLQFRVGDTAKFHCINQHQITYNLTGSPKIQCQGNGAWSAKPPRCKAFLCSPSPPTLPNAALVDKVVRGKTNMIGRQVRYKCTAGYSSPNLIKVCQKDGYWQGIVNCTAKLCPKIENLSNGHFEPILQKYLPGQRITFHCISDRYVVKGSAIKICLDDGNWSGSSTKCVINRCLPVGSFENGHPTYSREPYIIGTEVEFDCHAHFKLTGPKKRVCQRDGMWSGEKNPTCKAFSCSEPGVISKGHHFPQYSDNTNYPYDSTVKYQCDSQYYLYGNSTLTCKSYGKNSDWSSSPPECLTLAQFSSRCQKKNGQFQYEHNNQPKCVPKTSFLPATTGQNTSRQLDTLTIVTASAGSTLGALVILLSIMVFVRRFQRNRRFRHHAIRSRFYSDDDHVTLITCPRGYHFSLPSYDEAMSQVQRDPPPFDAVVQDNPTTVINNNINITMPSDDSSSHRQTSGSRTHGRTILQVSADQQVNIVNNPMPESSQGELDASSTANQAGSSARNSISSQESLQISEPPSLCVSEDEQSINESQPLIGSN